MSESTQPDENEASGDRPAARRRPWWSPDDFDPPPQVRRWQDSNVLPDDDRDTGSFLRGFTIALVVMAVLLVAAAVLGIDVRD